MRLATEKLVKGKWFLWMLFLVCISVKPLKAQPVGIDSFFCHDKDKRLICFNNGDYGLSFDKQKMTYVSSSDSVVRYDANQQALFINPGSPSWVKIELRETGPWLISRDTVYELDSMKAFRPDPHGSLGAIVGGKFQLNFKGMAFKIKYIYRAVDEISFEVDGHSIQLNWKPFVIAYNLDRIIDKSNKQYCRIAFEDNLPNGMYIYNYQRKNGFNFLTMRRTGKFALIDFKPNPPGEKVTEISPLFEYNRRGKLKRKYIPVHYCTCTR